jgi:hypothetical protein
MHSLYLYLTSLPSPFPGHLVNGSNVTIKIRLCLSSALSSVQLVELRIESRVVGVRVRNAASEESFDQ